MNKSAAFYLIVLLLSTVSFVLPLEAHAQSIVTPSYYPLAPCPTCTSPSEPVLSGAVTPSVGLMETTPVMTQTPCSSDSSVASDTASHSKHHKHHGAISNFMQQILKFFLKLINMLLQLLGGGQITMPSTDEPALSGVPSIAQSENPSQAMEEPSAAPMVNPCPSQAAELPDGSPVPNSAGTVAVPSISGPANSPSGTAQNTIDLSNWELTLPTGPAGNPTDIFQPQLATFTADPWYIKNADGSLRFRAAVNGVTTSGSNYPRSELREMKGTAEASWTSSTGTHIMTLDEAITAVPKTKQQVIAGQIHDGSSDVMAIRLEMPKLFVDIGGTEGAVLDANYVLGKKFTIKIEVTGSKTNVYYNGATTPAYSMTKSYSEAYFKAGAYTQSNCTVEAAADCNANNFSEVAIYSLMVSHQ